MAYVFDSSAVLAVLQGEPAGREVLDILERVASGDDELHLPFMALMEVRYRLLRDHPSEADTGIAVVDAWPAQVHESNPRWRETAARVKARGGLSLGDAWIAALALMHDAELVHKDPEFDNVEGLRTYPLP